MPTFQPAFKKCYTGTVSETGRQERGGQERGKNERDPVVGGKTHGICASRCAGSRGLADAVASGEIKHVAMRYARQQPAYLIALFFFRLLLWRSMAQLVCRTGTHTTPRHTTARVSIVVCLLFCCYFFRFCYSRFCCCRFYFFCHRRHSSMSSSMRQCRSNRGGDSVREVI